MKGLRGKAVVVTGAGGGIGRATALAFAREGARVAVGALHPEKAEETCRLVEEARGEAWPVPGDIGSPEGAADVMDAALSALGTVDVLVNNAGWTRTTPFLTENVDYWQQVLAVNLWAPILLTRRALEVMTAASGGAVVNVVSDAGRVGTGGEAVYSASKEGLVALTKSLAQEMARFGIRLNAVSPGPTRTRILEENARTPEGARAIERMTRRIPMRRVGEPEEVADAIVFLASDEARYITGQVLSVNGGLVMP